MQYRDQIGSPERNLEVRGQLHGIQWKLFVCKLCVLLFEAKWHGLDDRRGLNLVQT